MNPSPSLQLAADQHRATVRAQAKSVNDGVYTEAQAQRGAKLYAEQCAACHGERLTGIEPAVPGLLGLPYDYLVVATGARSREAVPGGPRGCARFGHPASLGGCSTRVHNSRCGPRRASVSSRP